MKNPPMLMYSELTGRVFIVTRYKVLNAEKGHFEALTKYDVTDQYNLVKKQEAQDQK